MEGNSLLIKFKSLVAVCVLIDLALFVDLFEKSMAFLFVFLGRL